MQNYRARTLIVGSSGKQKQTVNFITQPIKSETTTGTVPPSYLQRFAQVFSEPTSLPPKRGALDFRLSLTGTPGPSREIPIKNPRSKKAIKDARQDFEAKGFIRRIANPTVNPCSAFVVIDKASDGRGAEKARVVFDFVKLNAVTDVLPSVLPRILDLLRIVCKAKHFSKMDIRAGFHNLRMHDDSIKHTAVVFPGEGIFEWLVMPFGLAGAHGAMQALMREVLGDLIEAGGVAVYLDDILVYGHTQQEHDALLEAVLTRLTKEGLHLKASKCALNQTIVDFLGHRLSNGTFSPLVSNVQGLLDFSLPSTVQQWQRFHGMANFYRLHIPRFSDIMRPIASIMGNFIPKQPID